MRGGNALPTAKESSGIQSPRPELKTGEVPLSLAIRQTTRFVLFLSLWIFSLSMLWLVQHEGTGPREIFWAAEHAVPLSSRGGKQEENLCPSLISVNHVDHVYSFQLSSLHYPPVCSPVSSWFLISLLFSIIMMG